MAPSPRLPFDAPHEPDPFARDAAARRAAVDPRRNVVLEASAGTGKTRVLVDRYVNLIEAGIDPGNILAITFTRKAAAEMRDRILRRLREAAVRSPAHEAPWRALADRLGDVAITTIDAFCLLLLREFPLEADLEPGFDVADDTGVLRASGEALDRTMRLARRLAAADPDIALVVGQLGERALRSGLASLLERRLVARGAFLRALRGVPPALTAAAAARRLGDGLAAGLREIDGGLEGFLARGPADHPAFDLVAGDLRHLVAGEEPGPGGGRADPATTALAVSAVSACFLTADGRPRARPSSRYRKDLFPSAGAFRDHGRDIARLAPGVADLLAAYRRDLNAIATRGAWRLFRMASAQYRRRLEVAGVLDFTELLARALRLLARMDEFSQSRYRLEARYHHLLVDEFQDTSAAQWRLVSLLVQSWSEGIGAAHDALAPSIFVVGDRKQSIYGFRDADVRVLGRARRAIARLRPDERVRRSIARSFRAVPVLLRFANDLFSAIEPAGGRRDAFRFGPRDRFPVEPARHDDTAAGAAAPGWSTDAEALALVATDDTLACAEAIAEDIRRLLAGGIVRDRSTGIRRAARPGDVAILFRSRESHRAFEHALSARGIPSYVYKGLGFFDADEVKDLLALVGYLADPRSDLHAAGFLRSRFVRLSDRAIAALAGRLASALGDAGLPLPARTLDDEDRRVLERAREAVREWIPLVDTLLPATVIDRALADCAYAWETRGARTAQARENLKKMRGIVRRLQNRGYATMARLAEHLQQLSAGDESNAVVDALDAVNLMTVHAAKGLEFPIVFLVNLSRGSGGRRAPIRIAASGGRPGPSASAGPGVSVGDFVSEADDDSQAREREETKRLLYVAVTRARDRLCFATTLRAGRLRPAGGSLAQVLPASFQATLAGARPGVEAGIAGWRAPGGTLYRFAVLPQAAAATAAPPDAAVHAPPLTLPPAVDEPALERTTVTVHVAEEGLAPAGGAGPDVARGDGGEPAGAGGEEDRLLGTLVHRLLQLGLSVPAGREELVRRARSLLGPGDLALAVDATRLLASAAALCGRIREDPVFLALLEQGQARFEVPFSMLIAGGPRGSRLIRGAIDCLVREPDGTLTVIEFKTGSPRPAHDRQLQIYVDAARALFPGAPVRGLVRYPEPGLTG